jgi:hypothetical protein
VHRDGDVLLVGGELVPDLLGELLDEALARHRRSMPPAPIAAPGARGLRGPG